MPEFLKILLISERFIPHGHCYLWKPELVWLHVISDGLISLAYYSIPFMLVYFVRKRPDVPFNWIFLMFGTFIVACGTTHLLEIWTLWYPTYWLSGLIKAITALASLGTALLLLPLIPKALALPSPAQLETANLALRNEITQRRLAEEALQRANEQLEVKVQQRTAALASINESLQLEITERKRAEEALYRRKQAFRALVENSPDVIARFDRQLRHIYVNPAIERAIGIPSAAFLNKTNQELGMPEKFVSYWNEGIQKVFDTAEEKFIEFDWQTQTEVRSYHSHLVPEYARDGSVEFVLGVTRDITHLKQVESQIQESLQEKEILLQEIHHRVKNNLQVISSLLDLQSQYIEDALTKEMFRESQKRVKSMALVHEQLYQAKNFTKINFADYLKKLAYYLFDTYGIDTKQIQLKLNIEEITLTINRAIPCGLIITELVSNALKYAFSNRTEGIIEIAFSSDSDKNFTLIVRDDGIGLPKNLDFKKEKSLGLQLVSILANQLEATLELNCCVGTKVCLKFSETAH
ncbi:MAG TPA: histidine kinase dimerization/phosphoacceptor domain -containing protein [Coleofasciculaceae cyanobacterium]|jgi:PAS domain S-box-containing protein